MHPDVLIVTALQDELEAVLAAGAARGDEPGPGSQRAGHDPGARAGWEERRDRPGFRYHVSKIPNERGETLVVDAAFVERQLAGIAKNADLSRYVL